MECGVQAAPVAVAGDDLERAGDRVAPEQQPVAAGELGGLDRRPVGQRDLGPGGDVAAGLDDAAVAEGDADAGVGAQQGALADRDDLLPATGQGAHDRGATADVGARTHDDARADPALDHGGAQRAGVEVDEALVHDRGALGQVRTQPDPVGVGDPDAGGQDVVDHPRELVHAEDGHVPVGGAEQRATGRGQVGGEHRAGGGPGHVGQQPEDAVQVGAVRTDEPGGQQVQPQVGVVRVDRGDREVGDGGRHRDHLHAAGVVAAHQAGVLGAEQAGQLLDAQLLGAGLALVGAAERGGGEPGVQDGAVGGHGGQAHAVGAGGLLAARHARHATEPVRPAARPAAGPRRRGSGAPAPPGAAPGWAAR